MRGTAVPGPRCRCPPLLLLHQGAEAGLGDEAPHRVQLQWAVTSQLRCGPASPRHRPPVEADTGVDSEGGSGADSHYGWRDQLGTHRGGTSPEMAGYRRRLQWRDTGVHRGVYNHLQLSTIIYAYLRISTHVYPGGPGAGAVPGDPRGYEALSDGGWSKEWIADMSMDCDYDLTVSCVQLDLVDSPGADTEDQETESCRLTVSRL